MLAPSGPGLNAPMIQANLPANMAEAYRCEDLSLSWRLLHGIRVDSIICSIGSTNMDIRSFAINYELI